MLGDPGDKRDGRVEFRCRHIGSTCDLGGESLALVTTPDPVVEVPCTRTLALSTADAEWISAWNDGALYDASLTTQPPVTGAVANLGVNTAARNQDVPIYLCPSEASQTQTAVNYPNDVDTSKGLRGCATPTCTCTRQRTSTP